MKSMRYPEAAAITVEMVTARVPRREITELRDGALMSGLPRSPAHQPVSELSCHQLGGGVPGHNGFRARRLVDQRCYSALTVALDRVIDDYQQERRSDQSCRK